MTFEELKKELPTIKQKIDMYPVFWTLDQN